MKSKKKLLTVLNKRLANDLTAMLNPVKIDNTVLQMVSKGQNAEITELKNYNADSKLSNKEPGEESGDQLKNNMVTQNGRKLRRMG